MKMWKDRRKRYCTLFLAVIMCVNFLYTGRITVSAEEPSTAEEEMQAEESSTAEEEMQTEEPSTAEEEMQTEEPSTVEEEIQTEEPSTEEEDMSVEERIIFEDASEETIAEEIVETDMAQEDSTTEEEYVVTESEVLSQIVPEVIVKNAYDTYLTLTLSVPENLEKPIEGGLYYVVTVTIHKSTEEKAIEQSFYFIKEDAASQDVTIEMNSGLIEEGQEWTYDIEVRLALTKESNVTDLKMLNGATALASRTNRMSNITVTPYYEEKLSLKKGITTIYTTQKNVAVAIVKFGEKTTVKDNLKVEDVTYSKEENKQYALEFAEVGSDLRILASADKDTALGKHTIKVTAAAPEYMYASEAFITVNVVQGMEEGMLSLSTPSLKLYKADEKSATLTVKAEYHKDQESNTYPKTKKVTWEILSEKGNILNKADALYGMITVKNGKVTINKKYSVSSRVSDNRFIIKAAAKDFEGNTVCAYSEVIEISAEKEPFGEAAILQMDENGGATVTARTGATVTSDKLEIVRVFKENAPQKENYSKEELEQWTFAPEYLTYKVSNKSIKVGQDGSITSTKPVKNVKIVISANDKSGEKAEIKKLTIAYKQPEELALRIEAVKENEELCQIGKISAEDTDLSISSTADTRFILTVMQRDNSESEWKEVDAYVNFNLAVKNGKIIEKSGKCNECYLISTTKEKVTITLKDKVSKKTITYTITNTDYPKGSTPKLSTSSKLKAVSYLSEQTVTYILKKNGKFQYNYNGKSVLITTDNAEKYKSDKSEIRYNAFEEALGGVGYKEVSDGKVLLKFSTSDTTPVMAGSYKLWFTFGTVDSKGEFHADTAAIPVTLKAQTVKIEKGSYNPVTSYKMSVKEGGTLQLSGKGKKFLAETVEFSNLRNANVNGGPNEFREYFELIGNTLRIKENLSEEKLDYICRKSAKKDWSAHVDYKASVANTDGSYSEKTGTIKITINMQDSVRQFSLSKGQALDCERVVKVTSYADKKKVNIIYACTAQGSYDIEADGTNTLVLTPKEGEAKPKRGTNSVTVYLVPEGTYEANRQKLEALKNAWMNAQSGTEADARKAYTEAVKKYGIKVTATVEIPTREIDNKEMAEQVIALVNKEREAAGLNPLTMDEDLMYASFIRAKETAQLFSHTRPDGSSCFTILTELGITYWGAGENIAYGYSSPEAVMKGWMNSPGHRANILNSSFTSIGVGCYESNGRLYWTQLFITKPE